MGYERPPTLGHPWFQMSTPSDPITRMSHYWLGVARAWMGALAPFTSRDAFDAAARWDFGFDPIDPPPGVSSPQGLMPEWWPQRVVNLVGDARIRGFAIPRPVDEVAAFLPRDVVLGEQPWTAPGTHPLVFFFSNFARMRMSVPTLAPEMHYQEHIIGIPWVHTDRRSRPAFWLVRLFLDQSFDGWLAMVGGRVWWGYPKDPAHIDSARDHFSVHDANGSPQIALHNTTNLPLTPALDIPAFAAWREIQSMPLVTTLPLGNGPLTVLSDYDKLWPATRARPLTATLDIAAPPIAGLPRGAFSSTGFADDPLGAFEMETRIRGSLPYPTWLARR